jgi:hypothetical protein
MPRPNKGLIEPRSRIMVVGIPRPARQRPDPLRARKLFVVRGRPIVIAPGEADMSEAQPHLGAQRSLAWFVLSQRWFECPRPRREVLGSTAAALIFARDSFGRHVEVVCSKTESGLRSQILCSQLRRPQWLWPRLYLSGVCLLLGGVQSLPLVFATVVTAFCGVLFPIIANSPPCPQQCSLYALATTKSTTRDRCS